MFYEFVQNVLRKCYIDVGLKSHIGCDLVVCMIITTPHNWNTRAKAVINTWSRRCHIPLFFYSRSAASPDHPITKPSMPCRSTYRRDEVTWPKRLWRHCGTRSRPTATSPTGFWNVTTIR